MFCGGGGASRPGRGHLAIERQCRGQQVVSRGGDGRVAAEVAVEIVGLGAGEDVGGHSSICGEGVGVDDAIRRCALDGEGVDERRREEEAGLGVGVGCLVLVGEAVAVVMRADGQARPVLVVAIASVHGGLDIRLRDGWPSDKTQRSIGGGREDQGPRSMD